MSFQTERLGWNTDDFLIVCERTGAEARRLAGQVKRSFTVSAADDECVKTISDFWKDFKKADPFNPQHDRLVLVTLRGTNTLLEHFVGLLDCARAAATAPNSNNGSQRTASYPKRRRLLPSATARSSGPLRATPSQPPTSGPSCACFTC